MRILHIADSCGMYGKEQVLLNLIKQQAEDNIVNLFVTGKRDLVDEVHLLEKKINAGIGAIFISDVRTLIKMVLAIDPIHDVIHLHDRRDSIVFGALKALGIVKIPLARTSHGYTSIDVPLLSKKRVYSFAEKAMFRFHDAVVGVSDNMKDFKRVSHIVPNGIEPFLPDHMTIPAEFWKMHSDNFMIMCSARLSKEKNLVNLIHAIDMLRARRDELRYRGGLPKMGIKLLIFGEGNERETLEKLISDFDLKPEEDKLDEVYLMGFNKNARDYLRIVDIYIQPSYTEGMPISVLEAMCARRLTITSNVGGMTTLIDKGAVMGCACDYTSIASTIIKASHTNSDPITETAYNLFQSTYSSQAMAEGYSKVYNQVTKG